MEAIVEWDFEIAPKTVVLLCKGVDAEATPSLLSSRLSRKGTWLSNVTISAALRDIQTLVWLQIANKLQMR